MGIFIDNKYYSFINEKYTILQFCLSLGIIIPFFCYHERLSIAGNCRMCLIEVNNLLVASCAINISENMLISTTNKRVRLARESVLEFLLVNHPLDCPICDQGGECDPQDITLTYGSDKGRFYELFKRSVDI
jgi:NADH-quinone oxidoreductase subunit G